MTIAEIEAGDLRRDGDFVDIEVRVACSSGTYIRAIARDLGAALGVGGHLTALRRHSVGPFTLEDANTDLDHLLVTSPRPTPPARRSRPSTWTSIKLRVSRSAGRSRSRSTT